MGFNTRLYGSVIFRCRFSVLLWVHLIYYIYARNDRFCHADGFSFSFVLIQKKRKRKEKIKATSPDLLRKGRSGAEKWTRFVALRSDSIFQRRQSIPPLTPLRLGQSLFHAKALRCWLLDLWFYNATVSTPALIHFAVGFDGILFLVQLSWVYRIENSAFSHGILYT